MDAISQMSKRTLAAIVAGVLVLLALLIAIFGHHGGSKNDASGGPNTTPSASSTAGSSATSGGSWNDAPAASNKPDPFATSSTSIESEEGENGPKDPNDMVTQATDSHPSYAVPSGQSQATTYPATSPIYKASDTVADSLYSFSSSEGSDAATKRAESMKANMTDSMWSVTNPTGTSNAPWDAAKATNQAKQQQLSTRVESFTVRDVGRDMPNTADTAYLHVTYNLATYSNGTRVSSTPTAKAYVMKKVDGVWKVDQIMDDVN